MVARCVGLIRVSRRQLARLPLTGVDHLVASLKPRQAPREGIRRLPEPATAEPGPSPSRRERPARLLLL